MTSSLKNPDTSHYWNYHGFLGPVVDLNWVRDGGGSSVYGTRL